MTALAYNNADLCRSGQTTQLRPRTPQEAVKIRGWQPPTAEQIRVLGFDRAWVLPAEARSGAMSQRRWGPRDTLRGHDGWKAAPASARPEMVAGSGPRRLHGLRLRRPLHSRRSSRSWSNGSH